MKRTLIAMAVFIVLLLGGGATLVGGGVAAAKNSASPPGSTKDTWRTEFVQAGWNTSGPGMYDNGWLYASKDLESGNAYMQFRHTSIQFITCPDASVRPRGTEVFGFGPAAVDVKTNTATATANLPMQTTWIDDCFGPPQTYPSGIMTLTLALTSDGNTWSNKSDTCYPVIGGEICNTSSSTQSNAFGTVVEGSYLDHRVTGVFGHSRGSSTFHPY